MPALDPLLRPRSVAVIGASRRRESIGGAILNNLIEQGFQGPVYPVNPRATHVQSIPAYPSVADVPGPVDLGIIVIPAEHGVKAIVVISAGFKETGAEGLEREKELLLVVRRHGMRLVGPNCLGILNT